MAGVYLEVGFHGDRPGTFVSVPGQSIRLGRHEECEVRIDSDLVSRRHVELFLVDGERWMARDLGSSNGTFLNRRRIAEADVRQGDILRLGEGGPKMRVVVLNPSPDSEEGDDLEATRYLRVAPPPKGRGGKQSVPEYSISVRGADAPPPPQTDTEPMPPPTQRRRPKRKAKPKAAPRSPAPDSVPRRPWPWLMVVGIMFGAATGYGVWPDGFPYEPVAAPSLWASYGLAKLVPALIPKAGWVLTTALSAYWGLVGLALQYIRQGYPWLILFALAHAFAYVGLDRLGSV